MSAGYTIPERARLPLALAVSSLVSMLLYVIGIFSNYTSTFSYLPWNLFLAWLALVAAWWLIRVLSSHLWSSWYALFATLVWLLMLPNTFYMLSDIMHIQGIAQSELLYDIIMFTSFILNGVILGFLSLSMVHRELVKRISARSAFTLIGIVLFLSSFAIYIGRDLRWNTWDIVTNPFSVLVDISNQFLSPLQHTQAFSITFGFFILLFSTYAVIWSAEKVVESRRTR
jgi:uncharacterized membrane protein